METQPQSLEDLVKRLPADIREEVRSFVESLMAKRQPKREAVLTLCWRGALRGLRHQYTSVELQHAALKWLGD